MDKPDSLTENLNEKEAGFGAENGADRLTDSERSLLTGAEHSDSYALFEVHNPHQKQPQDSIPQDIKQPTAPSASSSFPILQPSRLSVERTISQYNLLELRAMMDKITSTLSEAWMERLRDRIEVQLKKTQALPWADCLNTFDGLASAEGFDDPSQTEGSVNISTGDMPGPLKPASVRRIDSRRNQNWFASSFSSEELAGPIVLVFSTQFLSVVFDRFLGGNQQITQSLLTPAGVANSEPMYPLTSIERRLLARLTDSFCRAWEHSWSRHVPIHFRYDKDSRCELIDETGRFPSETAAFNGDDSMAVCEFTVDWSEVSFAFYLIIPYYCIGNLRRIIDRRTGRTPVQDINESLNGHSLGASIRRAHVSLTAVLARSTMTAGDFLQLQPGDILLTDQRSDDLIEVLIDGRCKFKGTPGQYQNQKVVQIVQPDANSQYNQSEQAQQKDTSTPESLTDPSEKNEKS